MTNEPENRMTESEALEEVSTFFHIKRVFDVSPSAPPHWRENKARELLSHALDIAAHLCGREVMSLAYGSVKSESRRDHLLALADRLHWPALLFEDVESASHDGFKALAAECESVALGDAPVILAKLPGYRKKVRLLVAKYQANRWNAYLEGLGIVTPIRHVTLATAFGQEWDTMSRWTSDAANAWGAKLIESDLRMQRHHGFEDLRRLGEIQDDHWLPGVNRSGRIFKKQAGYTV